MLRPFTSFAAVAAVGLLAGCAGGGSVSPTSQKPGNSGGSPTTQSGKTRAKLTLVVRPSKNAKSQAKSRVTAMGGRKRDYIAPTTQGVIAEFVGSDSASDIAYQGYTLAPGAAESATSPASCAAAAADGSFTCTLFFALAPTIMYTTTLTAYDAAQSGSAAQPASGSSALSSQTQNLTISTNTTNTFAFTLSGIVEGFNITPQYVGVAGTSSGTGTLTGVFQALDADNNPIDEYDGSTAYVYGPQPNPSTSPATPGGPFVAASFPVAANDENEPCSTAQKEPTARKRQQEVSSTPCLTTTSIAVSDPTSETVSYAYNGEGNGGDGTTNNPPYYGEITLSPPDPSYGGFVSNGYAGSLFIVPFFGFVDSSSAYATGTASIAFTAPGQSINGFATQAFIPSGAPADGSGYTVDSSSCSGIASVGTPTYNAGVGISFPITPGTTDGSCTLTLSDDGTAASADTATISISNTTSSNSTNEPITVPSPGPVYSPNARKR